jgi:RNA polymerase sigma-70 factor (ECF subfamily)
MDDGDSDLVRRARGGDEDAFSELFRRHSESVFRLVVSILGRGHEGEAEEVTQEVFLRVHRSLHSFRGDAKFSSWIYRIAFNQGLNAKTRARHRKPHLDETALAETPSAEPGPEAALQTARRDRALIEAIQTLPEVYQSALHLYYWMDAGVAEVAELLDVPENTAKSYLHRARHLLDAMLKEKGYAHA